ncbi:CHAT domain-containing protein [Aquiflexum sp.]|uniref:CHAT domain-containing protein n=1 Tax=Aquiflexum sp. TaxID=1872584 RepID=UPI00359424DC
MNVSTIKVSFHYNKIQIVRSVESSEDDILVRESIELELNVARIFHKVLNKARIIEIFEKRDYELLGEMLYKILTATEKVRIFFINILAEVIRDKDSRCLFFLEFLDNTNEFASLPWEYLYIPYNQERKIGPLFIGADPKSQFDLFRFLKSEFQVPEEKFNPDEMKEISVVLVYVNAADRPINQLGLQNTFKSLIQKYASKLDDGSPETSGFNVYPIQNPTKENIFEQISLELKNIEGPYVLHFMGHAEMRKDGSYLGLAGDNGKIDYWNAESFVDLFDQQKNDPIRHPSLVFLQACESGQIDEKGSGLGIGLVKAGISPVIAMQNEITEDVSNAFVQEVYQFLMEGDDIFHSVSKGRYFLGCEYSKNSNSDFKSYNTNFFGTPVVFTNKATSPLRLMPKIKNMESGKKEINTKRCSRCTSVYENPTFEYCNKNFCGGKLIPVQTSTEAKADSSASTSKSETARVRTSSSTSSN